MSVKKTESWHQTNGRAELNAAHLKTMQEQAEKSKISIAHYRLEIGIQKILITGTSSLIVNNWSEKAKQEIRDRQSKKAKKGRETRNPVQDFVNSLYTIEDGELVQEDNPSGLPDAYIKGGKFGFPSIAFKNAAVDACTSLDKEITKVAARQQFHVLGDTPDDLVIINGVPRMREDAVKIKMTTDLRYRAEFFPWNIELKIRYNRRFCSIEQIVNLFILAGFAVGVGEWRPSTNGSHGMFEAVCVD